MAGISVGNTVGRMVVQGVKAYYDYDTAKDAERELNKAADRTEALNDLNERTLEAETAEQERRILAVNTENESIARARAAASGTALTGSTANYLAFLEDENIKEFEYTQGANTNKLATLKAEGESSVRALRSQAKGQRNAARGAVIGGAADILDTGFEAGGWTGEKAWYA